MLAKQQERNCYNHSHFHNSEKETFKAMSKTHNNAMKHEGSVNESSTVARGKETAIDSIQDVTLSTISCEVSGAFDKSGGFFVHPKQNLLLYVPPGALTSPQSVKLTMRIIQPQDTPTKKHVMPIIVMGPEGTHFKQPVYVCYQRENDSSKGKVCVDIKQTNDEWKHADKQDAIYYVNETVIIIGLWHFTGIRAREQQNQGRGLEEAAAVGDAGHTPVQAQDLSLLNPSASNEPLAMHTPVPDASNHQTVYVAVYERSLNSDPLLLTIGIAKDLKTLVQLSNVNGFKAIVLPRPFSLHEDHRHDVRIQMKSEGEIVKDEVVRVGDVIVHGYSCIDVTFATHQTNLRLCILQDRQGNKVDVLIPSTSTTNLKVEKTFLRMELRFKILRILNEPEQKKAFEKLLKKELKVAQEVIDEFEKLHQYQEAERIYGNGYLVDIFEMALKRLDKSPAVDGPKILMAHFQSNPDSILLDIEKHCYPETNPVIRQPEGEEGEVQRRTHKKRQGNKQVGKDSGYTSYPSAEDNLSSDESLPDVGSCTVSTRL